ncbi:hypothetical protein PT974_06460 [Cladobotryum mycophilum]|uniref:DUF4470 domain-containing protein n=1 Tax=Cladobotryum mycophilum TaxID=491253 RepID=A0ABR0SLN9_9HYPO
MDGSILPCANVNSPDGPCKEEGRFACKACQLVQVSHWRTHSKDCKSPMLKTKWEPGWVLDGHQPAFVGEAPSPMVHFGGLKYLWGNMPAIDMLKLEQNEGEAFEGRLRLLCAASGDPRNVIKTIASLPDGFKGAIHVTMNDKDTDIVARNVVILLIALTFSNVDEAVDLMIHVWYSALLTQRHADLLRTKVRPFLKTFNDKIAGKNPKSLQAKTWNFGPRSIRLVFTKEVWGKLLGFVTVSETLTRQEADVSRTAITLCPERRDYRDRQYTCLLPAQRMCQERYRTDGVLLPFGHSREPFTVPNPTFFQNNHTWPVKDSSDPFGGWDMFDVLDKTPRAAASDIYGKLYYYIENLCKRFLARLRRLPVGFELFNMETQELPKHVRVSSFARIEVANMSDMGYLGYAKTLAYLGPLLQPKISNPHATLIMLFMNAVRETMTEEDTMADMVNAFPHVQHFVTRPESQSTYDVGFIRYTFGMDRFRDNDRYFNKYMRAWKFEDGGRRMGMAIKEKHTIIDKWPLRLRKIAGEEGSREEFDMSLGTGHAGDERYMEWKFA